MKSVAEIPADLLGISWVSSVAYFQINVQSSFHPVQQCGKNPVGRLPIYIYKTVW